VVAQPLRHEAQHLDLARGEDRHAPVRSPAFGVYSRDLFHTRVRSEEATLRSSIVSAIAGGRHA
jgi:hypothetical protein